MAASLGLEDSEESCIQAVWQTVRTQIDTHAFDAMRRGMAEILESWPVLTASLRSAVLEIVRAGKSAKT